MNIKPIILPHAVDLLEPKLTKKFTSLTNLIFEAGKHSLPDDLVIQINSQIDQIAEFSGSTKETIKILENFQKELLQKLKSDFMLFPKNHHRNLWMALGMTTFGIPIGLTIGISLDNLALLALGLPIGMSIGIAVGTSLDQKVKNEGRQLDFNLN